MSNSISSIVDELATDVGTLQSLLIHASAGRRTKEEIREDLDKMSEVVNKIEKLIK